MKADDRPHNVHEFPHNRRSDGDLVLAVAEGDERSLTVLFQRHAPSIRRTLNGCMGSNASVDDLVQEVFLSLMRNASKIRQPESIRSYLAGAAVQLARRKHREESRRKRWLGLFVAESSRKSSGPIVQERAALRKLEEILDDLPVRYRESFVLRFVEGFSTVEVAEARQVSLATAKRDVHQAQERVLLRARRDEELNRYLRDEVGQLQDTMLEENAIDRVHSEGGQS